MSDGAEVRIEEVPPASPDAEYCLSRYFAELAERFEDGFDAAQSSAPTLDGFEPPRGSFIVMYLADRPVAWRVQARGIRLGLHQAHVGFP